MSGQDGGGWSKEPPAWPHEARGLLLGSHSVPFEQAFSSPHPASVVWLVSIGDVMGFCSLLIPVVTGG